MVALSNHFFYHTYMKWFSNDEKEKEMINLLKRNQKWAISLSLVLLMVLGIFGSVSAAEFPGGETIPATQTIDDDVFISGDNVVIDGTVNGILFASGKTVTVNGTISGDAILMGETIVVSKSAVIDGNLFVGAAEITVDGTVTGSVFGGSSAMNSNAAIGRNLFYGGFSLTTGENSKVARDLYTGAYQAILSGAVERDLKLGAASLVLNGTVGRDAVIDLGDIDESTESIDAMSYNPWISKYVEEVQQPGLTISDSASIGGKVTYTSSVDESSELDAAAAGTVIYQTPVPYTEGQPQAMPGNVKPFEKGYQGGFAWAAALNVVRSFIRLFVLGALALWLLQKPLKKLVDAAYKQPFKAMGWGFVIIAVGVLAMFIVPLVFIMIGVLIGFLSLGSLLFVWFGLVGTILSLAVLLFFFVVFTLSKVIVAYMFGAWLMKALFKQAEEKVWLNLLVGVFLFVLIQAIPVIGWLADLAATLIGTGAFWLVLANRKTAVKKA